jgi:hypothetical protein
LQFNIDWLLSSSHPAVRFLALTALLDLPEDNPQVVAARADVLSDPWVRGLFSGQQSDGTFTHPDGSSIHPYNKWMGAHWRLVSLVELGIPAGEPRAVAATESVLNWLTGETHRSRILTVDGRTRRCASQEGNALAVCCRLGLAGDPRVILLAQSLVSWQWPDGGWNCDKRPQASHSSFHESLIPMWGLIEYHHATGNTEAFAAAQRAAEFFLRHRLFRSERTGNLIHPEMLELHYPPYWHYDILQGLLVLSRKEFLQDERASEALELLQARAHPDGTWRAARHYWQPTGNTLYQDPAGWVRRGPNPMVTINALRVLKAAGRISVNATGDENGPVTRSS